MNHKLLRSDASGLAWPDSHGLGLTLKGLGLEEHQARPVWMAWPWPGLGLGLSQGL
jgi:hypothetical protein